MKTSQTLLDRFDAVDEVYLLWRSQTGSARASLMRQVNALLGQEDVYYLILASLEAQRMIRNEQGMIQMEPPHITDLKRQEFVRQLLPHTVENFAQQSWSLPKDYRVLDTSNQAYRNQNIQSIVIQPELLSDDFLISLGIMSSSDTKRSYREKIEIKARAVENIKELLQNVTPLSLPGNRQTGRISIISDSTSPHYGKYLIFQEKVEYNSIAGEKKWKPIIRVTPRIHKDIYSLIRSQLYAIDGMHEDVTHIDGLMQDDILMLLLKWKDPTYPRANREKDIATIIASLEQKRGYNIERALKDRLRRIAYDHPERDKNRINGAYGDLRNAKSDKYSKSSEISHQTGWLVHQVSSQSQALDTLYQGILSHIEDGKDLFDIKKGEVRETGFTLTLEQQQHIDQIRSIFRNFLILMNSGKWISLGAPYHTLGKMIAMADIELRDKHKNKEDHFWYLVNTLKLILDLKMIRTDVFLLEMEHQYKLAGKQKISDYHLRSILEKIDIHREQFQNVKFLPNIELKSDWQSRFENMTKRLQILRKNIEQKSL